MNRGPEAVLSGKAVRFALKTGDEFVAVCSFTIVDIAPIDRLLPHLLGPCSGHPQQPARNTLTASMQRTRRVAGCVTRRVVQAYGTFLHLRGLIGTRGFTLIVPLVRLDRGSAVTAAICAVFQRTKRVAVGLPKESPQTMARFSIRAVLKCTEADAYFLIVFDGCLPNKGAVIAALRKENAAHEARKAMRSGIKKFAKERHFLRWAWS